VLHETISIPFFKTFEAVKTADLVDFERLLAGKEIPPARIERATPGLGNLCSILSANKPGRVVNRVCQTKFRRELSEAY